MNKPLLRLLCGGALLLASCATSSGPGPTAGPPGDKLVIQIAYDDPIFFDHYRYGFANGQDIVLGTLTNQGPQDAAKAHWPTPLVVIDDQTPPPPGEPILRLTWTTLDDGGATGPEARGGTVAADYLPSPGAKAYYLGIVSRQPLAFGPDPNGAVDDISRAPNSLAKRDARVEAQVEEYLYIALGYLEHHLHMSSG